MLLSKIEIKGFKSFGDKITINFDEGITGIVGPNGCGKSNIVDAIRWVLGEQKTRTIRTEKMEGIIFNGTKTRKALQMAEATLTFNNTKNILPTDYSTVTVTRRYYRSGDSEFLLNNVPCRLKDITNLFLDTGIGSDSYAIIELGMVDDIIKDKDNSRRLMFEEAAGISKFRIRKRETMRKLDDTDTDLERVEDLIYEIEKNMRSLERQARATRRYFKLKEEYKEHSIKLARKSLKRQKDTLDSIQNQIDAENDKKISLAKQVSEKDAEIENAKANLIETEKLLALHQKTLNDHVGKIRNTESEKKIKNERLRYLNDKSDSLKEQIDQDKKSNERASFSLKSLNQEKASAEKIYSDIELKFKSLKEEYDEEKERTRLIQEEVNSINEVYKIRREEVFQINKDLEIKQIQLNALKQELDKTATDSSEQKASLVEFEEKTKSLSGELSTKNKDLQQLKDRESDLQKRIESAEKTIEVIRQELADANRKLDARQNEYNLTKSLVENLEGFPEAIKFLKKQKNWGKDAPLLSDILTTEEKYRVTIENYLEPWMNYYVVEKESDAYKAVNLLSEASKGRAHFFILENLKSFSATKTKIFDNAIPATEIVEYDEKYKKLISFILDNVYITTGHHTSIPEDTESTFISQNGMVARRKFSLSGGSVGLFEGKRIGRARNLENLDKEIKFLNKKITQIQQSLSEEQQELIQLKESTKKDSIEVLQSEINILNESYISLTTKQEQYEQLITNQSTKKEDFRSRMEHLSGDIQKLQPQTEKEQIELETLSSKLSQLEDELKNQTELLNIKSNAYNQENILIHQQQNKVNSVDQEIGFKASAFESSNERIKKNQEELKNNEEDIRKLMERSGMSDDELVALYEEKEKIEQRVNEAEKEYYTARGNIDQLEKEGRNIQHSREAIDTLLLELQGKLNDTKLELSSVKERMSVEFNINLDDILKQEVTEEEKLMDESVLREDVETSREKLDKIGPINPMAMEAFDEIKERLDFISVQREDLLKAKESLMTTIGEIDLAARATFMEAFEKIKLNFMKVFRSLFSEQDDCDLKLSLPDDPLNSSIDIIAKPKGKRPLTINQLSGGEKSLTATSLLFAIYLLKPAPFCIFDEVDAPLDDANIDKFNNIIRKFSNESQFIIVTHNKRTMATTDVIYGITMVEQGVSRVVPVDLRELQED